jgi:uncharacterized protein (TIGR00369 family)
MSPTVLVSAIDLLLGVEDIGLSGEPDSGMRGRMPLDERHLGPDGRVSVGALGVLVDEVLGYSLIASTPPGSFQVSTEIWVDVLAPLRPGAMLHATGRTVQVGSFATGWLVDDEGRCVAECRERGREIDDVPAPEWAPTSPAAAGREAGTAAVLGLSLADPSTLTVTPELENPRHMLHGGASFAAAELVATWSRQAAGSELTTSSVHCVHSRPAPAGALVELTATTVHAGRSLWVSDVSGTVDGRPVVLARVTAQ